MNRKIHNLIKTALTDALMPKDKREDFDLFLESIESIGLTPARERKMMEHLYNELGFYPRTDVCLWRAILDADERYMNWYFGTIWKPRTNMHAFTGWGLVEEINSHNPKNVLDYGCGYNIFKDKIPNLIGIDPFNTAADYMVTIDEFKWKEKFDAILVLGSLNFGDENDIDQAFASVVEYLAPGGRIYFRANPGIQWPDGPYVDIYEWDFGKVTDLAEKHNLHIETFKKDDGDRLYFVFRSLQSPQA